MTEHPFEGQMLGTPSYAAPSGQSNSGDPSAVSAKLPGNGEFLLQLLKGGNNQKSNNEQLQQYSEQGLWQFHDPAVAAHGPSHSFPIPFPPVGETRPPFMSPQMRWSPPQYRQDHPFMPPGELPYSHLAENPFHQSYPIPMDRHFQPPVPYHYQHMLNPPFHSSNELPIPQQVDGLPPPFPPSMDSAFGPPMQRTSPQSLMSSNVDTSGNQQKSEVLWQAPQTKISLSESMNSRIWSGAPGPPIDGSYQKQPEQPAHLQFYGNGSELLLLLQGNAGRVHDTSPPKEEHHALSEELKEGAQEFQKLGQKIITSTSHGPIGPPKKTHQSPPPSPNDLLGPSWTAATSSGQSREDSISRLCIPEGNDRKESNLKVLINDPLWQIGCKMDTVVQGKKLDSFPDGLMNRNNNSLIIQERNGPPGFSILKRGSELQNMHPLGAREENTSNHNQKMRYGNRLKAQEQSHYDTLQDFENSDIFGKETDSQFSYENGREEARRGRGLLRNEIKKASGRSLTGQGHWMPVHERQRGLDAEAAHGDYYEEKDDMNYSKVSNAAHSKARDDLRRRRRQQQEWRLKQPQAAEISYTDNRNRLSNTRSLAAQVDHPGLPPGSTRDSTIGPALEESRQKFKDDREANGSRARDYKRQDLDQEGLRKEEELLGDVIECLELDETGNEEYNGHALKSQPSTKGSDIRQDRLRESRRRERGLMLHAKSRTRYRADLEKFTPYLLTLYSELIPSEEEELMRRAFLSRLDSLVEHEWPGAKLFLFGSCANAFGVRNSDIDVCLTVDEEDPNKAELVVRMADILEANDMASVQALTHARVPIVKFTEPLSGISCDICVNNMLAVVNSKLLHDYAKIDVRLRQLAFIVKHWAKSRQVNETYRGTLSSYAYVLMCIHFLQQRTPPILPCLQAMEATYQVKVNDISCAYYDQVETLKDYGKQNNETLGELVTAFFEYWAYGHDYNRAVISVRTGGFLSKDQKDWTRRIGNERHLICIEDPFEVAHDLGRVVDKHSIRVLRDEFCRAADILRYDPRPCVTLFEPYIR